MKKLFLFFVTLLGLWACSNQQPEVLPQSRPHATRTASSPCTNHPYPTISFTPLGIQDEYIPVLVSIGYTLSDDLTMYDYHEILGQYAGTSRTCYHPSSCGSTGSFISWVGPLTQTNQSKTIYVSAEHNYANGCRRAVVREFTVTSPENPW